MLLPPLQGERAANRRMKAPRVDQRQSWPLPKTRCGDCLTRELQSGIRELGLHKTQGTGSSGIAGPAVVRGSSCLTTFAAAVSESVGAERIPRDGTPTAAKREEEFVPQEA